MRDTGIGIYDPLFFIGVVENKSDGRREGRVQVRAFGVHGTVDQVPTESLPWATLIHGSYDPNAPIPPVNSFVFGFFVDGRDAQQPMILGLIPTQMTENPNPEITGWGRIPTENAELLTAGSDPESYGQPALSNLARGEDVHKSYVLLQEMNRVKDIPVASDGLTEEVETAFDEPAAAYNAEYPFNRVIKTSSHSIELDDTPNAERITIFHKSGSFVSIDSRGTTTHKSKSDKYEINDSHQHVYVGGKNYVTIVGDSKVLVQGNKIEEIIGNYTQIVHGNHMVSVAGQMNLNGSEEIQMRSAAIRIEANVENVNIKAAKFAKIQTGQSIHMKSGENIFQQAVNSINVKAGDNIFIECGENLNLKAKISNIESADTTNIKANNIKIGGGTYANINAGVVLIDDVIQLANGLSEAPGSSAGATGAFSAVSVEMPQPAAKIASTTRHKNTSSLGSTGYASKDEGETQDAEPVSGEIPPPVGKSSPPGSPLTAEQEEAAWKALEEKERSKRLAAGLPAKFSESERKALKAIMTAEGGDQAGNLAVVLNRSYQSKAPVDLIVMANKQFTPATSYLTGYSDRIAGTGINGFDRFVGAYTSPATTSFADAVSRYQDVPGANTINYFVGKGLKVNYGTLNYEAGNKYSSGAAGNFSAGGAANLQKLNNYLTTNGLN